MEKGFLLSSATAVASACLLCWTLYKWQKAEQELNSYREKFKSDREVQKSLVHHYRDLKVFPHLKGLLSQTADKYHERLAHICWDACLRYEVSLTRILDVGCGTGGTSFQLTKYFKEVIGSEISSPMIAACLQMKQFGEFVAAFPSEGGQRITPFPVCLPEGINKDRLVVWDEDACSLLPATEKFGCVLVSNVLTCLKEPKQFLQDINQTVYVGGLLIIADTYNWPSTPELPLGDSGVCQTFSKIKKILSPHWTFLEDSDLGFFIPQCERQAEVGNAHVTIWQRNNFSE